MADAQHRQILLTALTTEHFTLQGARSTTVSENTGRSSLYLTAVSSALVALGFIGQVSDAGSTFRLFSLAVIPVSDASPGLAVAVGAVAAGGLVIVHLMHERRMFTLAFASMNVAFPSSPRRGSAGR